MISFSKISIVFLLLAGVVACSSAAPKSVSSSELQNISEASVNEVFLDDHSEKIFGKSAKGVKSAATAGKKIGRVVQVAKKVGGGIKKGGKVIKKGGKYIKSGGKAIGKVVKSVGNKFPTSQDGANESSVPSFGDKKQEPAERKPHHAASRSRCPHPVRRFPKAQHGKRGGRKTGLKRRHGGRKSGRGRRRAGRRGRQNKRSRSTSARKGRTGRTGRKGRAGRKGRRSGRNGRRN